MTKKKTRQWLKSFIYKDPLPPQSQSLKQGCKRAALFPLECVPICAISSLGTTLMYRDHVRVFPACRKWTTHQIYSHPPLAGRFRNTAPSHVRNHTLAIISILHRNRCLAPVCTSFKRSQVQKLLRKLRYLLFLNIQECSRRDEVSEVINLQQWETNSITH